MQAPTKNPIGSVHGKTMHQGLGDDDRVERNCLPTCISQRSQSTWARAADSVDMQRPGTSRRLMYRKAEMEARNTSTRGGSAPNLQQPNSQVSWHCLSNPARLPRTPVIWSRLSPSSLPATGHYEHRVPCSEPSLNFATLSMLAFSHHVYHESQCSGWDY